VASSRAARLKLRMVLKQVFGVLAVGWQLRALGRERIGLRFPR